MRNELDLSITFRNTMLRCHRHLSNKSFDYQRKAELTHKVFLYHIVTDMFSAQLWSVWDVGDSQQHFIYMECCERLYRTRRAPIVIDAHEFMQRWIQMTIGGFIGGASSQTPNYLQRQRYSRSSNRNRGSWANLLRIVTRHIPTAAF